ncbi:MAG: hypothetical protein LKI24_02895 [Acidipropionibacterium sp.]|jgi:ascorbate-specific PTS system EIIC-type component UlaA|nr:hypothetical protein [Acidipropionibacterium sp.]
MDCFEVLGPRRTWTAVVASTVVVSVAWAIDPTTAGTPKERVPARARVTAVPRIFCTIGCV